MTEQKKVPCDMKLEVVMLGVSEADRAKAFYENLGWRLDIAAARRCTSACRFRIVIWPRRSMQRRNPAKSPDV